MKQGIIGIFAASLTVAVMGSGCKTTSSIQSETIEDASPEIERVSAPVLLPEPTPEATPEPRKLYPDRLGEYYDHLLQAQLYRSEGEKDPQRATEMAVNEIASLKAALALDPGSGYLRAQVADRLLRLGQPEEARKEAERAIQDDASTALAYLVLGRIARAEGQADRAIELLEQAAEASKEGFEIELELAQVYQEKGDWRKANELFEKIGEEHPHLAPRLYQAIAQNFMLQGQLDRAIEYYERSARLLPYPYNLQVLRSMGLAYLHQQKYDEAAGVFERLRMMEPEAKGKLEAELLLADTYSRQGNYDKAAESYRKVTQTNPEQGIAWRQLGLISYYLGQYSEAVRCLSESLKRSPDDWQVLEHLGLAYAELEQDDQAIALLERLAEAGQAGTQASVELAELYAKTGQAEKAQETIQKALDKGEDQAGLYFALGVLQYDNRRTAEAEASLKKVLELEPDHKGAMLYLGLVYDRMERLDLLEATIRQALAQDDTFAEGYNLLGYALADRGLRLDEAEQLLLKAVQLRPGRGFIIDSLGWVYYQQGRYAEAVAKLEQAAVLSGDRPDWVVLDHLGDAYLKVERLEDAVRTWKQAVESRKQNPDAFDREEDIRRLEQKILDHAPVQ
jgi:tetratricopeptide (TPR) repeat protein